MRLTKHYIAQIAYHLDAGVSSLSRDSRKVARELGIPHDTLFDLWTDYTRLPMIEIMIAVTDEFDWKTAFKIITELTRSVPPWEA